MPLKPANFLWMESEGAANPAGFEKAMSYILKPSLIGATAIAVGAGATLTAFSAPKPDAPVVTVPKPRSITVKVQPKRAVKRTTVIFKRADRAQPTGLKVIVIDEPNVQDGTISVVTEKDEFATIATGMGTRIARGYQPAGLSNIHPGYVLRCQGAWDQDGFQYQARSISLGETKRDTDVIARVNAACENIGKARKGGGFGKSLVAMIPPTPTSQGISIGGRSYATPSPAPGAAVPEDLIASQNGAPATPAVTQPVSPALVPASSPVAPTTPAPAPAAPTQAPAPVTPQPQPK
jgi:hypothetical protein